MIYVQESLVPEEKIIFGGYFHWMYTVSAVTWIFIGFLLSLAVIYGGIKLEYSHLPASYYMEAVWQLNPLVRLGALAMFLFGIFKFALMMATRATTEIAITNRRLIYKRGIIARHVDEISIDRIEGVMVEQGILGRLFQYGTVVVRGMGVGAVVLPNMIMDPVHFRKAVEKAREY